MHLSFDSIRSRMSRARAAVRPPTPQILGRFEKLLAERRVPEIPREAIFRGTVISDDHSTACIFMSKEAVATLNQACEFSARIFSDGTFKAR